MISLDPVHIPVLKTEILNYFSQIQGENLIFLDGTAGEAGHSLAILENIPNSRVLLVDRDEFMLERAKRRLANFQGRFFPLLSNFSEIDQESLAELQIEKLDGILLDFGISTFHIKNSDRGFSFQSDEPLDMRLSPSKKTAADILRTYDEKHLEQIFLNYGEENWSRKIAANIVETRRQNPILRTKDLNQLIEKTIPRKFWPPKVHPAFRIYQALRIEVNGELDHIKIALENLPKLLNHSGILQAISFHSLEDRITKQTLKQLAESGDYRILTKKPISATDEEIKMNPASRSAKLRVLEAVK
jgi:16S rRNA (cytosine1402-N4)-methyltransferase